MQQTQITFQCPSCHSFNTVLKNIRVVPMDSHDGFYYLDIDMKCQDCLSAFSKKFTAPAPHEFRQEVDNIVKATPDLSNLRLSLRLDSSDCKKGTSSRFDRY